jgi:hypothetical protein
MPIGHYTVGTAHRHEWASIDEVNMGAATLDMTNPATSSGRSAA